MRRCRLLLSGLAALAGTALASSSSSPISVTVQQSVHVGDAIKFQWCVCSRTLQRTREFTPLLFGRTGGTPPYTLKVYLNDKVVSQNEGWETNYVQWRANADQVPAGTSVRVRVTDSTGQSVMSEPTVVESDGKSVSTKKDSSYPNPTGHTTDHDKTGSGEATTDGGNTKSLMDDPNNRFSTSDGFGASAIQTGGRMLSAAVMPSDWQPTQGSAPTFIWRRPCASTDLPPCSQITACSPWRRSQPLVFPPLRQMRQPAQLAEAWR